MGLWGNGMTTALAFRGDEERLHSSEIRVRTSRSCLALGLGWPILHAGSVAGNEFPVSRSRDLDPAKKS